MNKQYAQDLAKFTAENSPGADAEACANAAYDDLLATEQEADNTNRAAFVAAYVAEFNYQCAERAV